MSSTLMTHSSRFQSQITSLAALQAMPEPIPMGPMHKPVAHAALVDAIHAQVDQRGFRIVKEQLALGAKGAALFGVIDMAPVQGDLVVSAERGMSFGFRNSTDQSMAIQGVAGTRVTVCDNLMLSGDLFAIQRKNTSGLDLMKAMVEAFEKFLKHSSTLDIEIMRLQATVVADAVAKEVIFDAFNQGVVPVKLFDDVSRFYFKATDETPDCTPRSLWGLHNSFTRAMKELSPVRSFAATVALGKLFGLRSKN